MQPRESARGDWNRHFNFSSDRDYALVENAKASIRFLPPYSPDLSPIEPCWSKVKQIIRSLQARTLEALDLAIVQGLRAVTCSDTRGWFRLCGYRVP